MTFNPAAYFIRHWQVTTLALLLLIGLGLNAFNGISRSEDPQYPVPVVRVTAAMPGASALEMEQLVAKPIENALSALDDVKQIQSFNAEGVSVITTEFDWRGNADRRYDEAVREVGGLRSSLPERLTNLQVKRVETNEVATMQIAIVSDVLPDRRLEKVARDLRDRLNQLPGVRQAHYWGAAASEVRVAPDMSRLQELRLPADSVVQALQAAGDEAPIGAVHVGERRFNIKGRGAFRSLADVGDVLVTSIDGRPVRIRDVAHVSWASDEKLYLTRFNGHRALFVTINQKDGADVADLNAQARAVVEEFRKTLPGSVRLAPIFSQDEEVSRRLNHLYRDFAIALGLVIVTLLPLGLRASLIVMISIPLSLLTGLTALSLLGFTLNQVSIAGFILALGLLVDDAIVVTENIARRIREGEDRRTAAINGVQQIATAVLGCTATLMLAFLPLLFLPDAPGAYIRSLPVAVLATVGASLVISLTIVPFLAHRLLSDAHGPEGNWLLRGLNRWIHGVYQPLLHLALRRPAVTAAALLSLCLLTVPMLMSIGTSLFPSAEKPQFLVRIFMPDGTSIAKTEAVLEQVERRLLRERAVTAVAGNIGRGNPQVYYNVLQYEGSTNFAEALVALKSWEGAKTLRLLDDLRSDFAKIPGAHVTVHEFQNGTGMDAPIAVRIVGDDMDTLKAFSRRTEAILRATPGVRATENPLRLDGLNVDLNLDAGKVAMLGVPAGAAERTSRMALSGVAVARYRDPDGDDYPVKVRLPTLARNELSDLGGIYLPTIGGGSVRLTEVASPTLASTPTQIDHYNRQRTVTVTAQVQSGTNIQAVFNTAIAALKRDLRLPPGYSLVYGGEVEASSRTFNGVGAAVLVAITGILAVLVLEFGKFRSALVVAGIIPFGVLGAFTALWLAGMSLSFTAAIGIVALIGIEIKNSILLVDFAEQLRQTGADLRTAIEKAGAARFLPVLLTSVTAIAGLLPLAVSGSGLYAPLAVAIIGGLISSTLLSRLATPVFYLLLEDSRIRLPRWRRKPSALAAGE